VLIIGCDESGTGAIAGPFHVGVVACEVLPFNRSVGRYLKDSKKMSDLKRRAAVPLIQEAAVCYHVEEVRIDEIKKNHTKAWAWGIIRSLVRVLTKVGSEDHQIIIDGAPNSYLVKKMWGYGRRIRAQFMVEADQRIPAVMAAAILAKTARNDAMLELSHQYPVYGWERNAGYGTQEHLEACSRYGVTEQHRHIKRLRGLPRYTGNGSWFEER
jgi:ribonuclease HII